MIRFSSVSIVAPPATDCPSANPNAIDYSRCASSEPSSSYRRFLDRGGATGQSSWSTTSLWLPEQESNQNCCTIGGKWESHPHGDSCAVCICHNNDVRVDLEPLAVGLGTVHSQGRGNCPYPTGAPSTMNRQASRLSFPLRHFRSGRNDGRLGVAIDSVFRRKGAAEVPRSVLGDRVAGY